MNLVKGYSGLMLELGMFCVELDLVMAFFGLGLEFGFLVYWDICRLLWVSVGGRFGVEGGFDVGRLVLE